MRNAFLVGLSLVVSALFAAGQILVKRAVGFAEPGSSLAALVVACLARWEFWAGGCATAAGAVIWMRVLSLANISAVYPLIGMTFVFVMVGGVWLLGERVTTGGVVGALLVIAGVATIAWRG